MNRFREISIIVMLLALICLPASVKAHGNFHTPAPAGIYIEDAGDIPIDEIGDATWDTVQEAITAIGSAGIYTGGRIADAGGGQITVSAVQGAIRIANTHIADLVTFDLTALSATPMTANAITYVGIEYNSGAPQFILSATDNFDYHQSFIVGSVVAENGTLHVLNNPQLIVNSAAHIVERLRETEPFVRAARLGGLILGESGDNNRNLTLSASEVYDNLNEFDIDAIDTSGADTIDIYCSATSEYTSYTQWTNLEYCNSGTKTTLGASKYAVFWVWVEADGDGLMGALGTAQYSTSTGAALELIPATLPNRIIAHGVLVGRIIFQKSATLPEATESRYKTDFGAGEASDHLNLSNIGSNPHTTIDTHLGSTANPHDVTAEQAAEYSLTSIGVDTTVVLDLANGARVFSDTVDTGGTSYTVTNMPSSAVSILLYLTNAASQVITWGPGWAWPGGSPPTFTNPGIDIIGCSSPRGLTLNCAAAGTLDMK